MLNIIFNFIFLFSNKVINNYLIDPDNTLFKNIIATCGLKKHFLNIIEKRIENTACTIIKDLNKNEWEHFIDISYQVVPYRNSIFYRQLFNILMLETISTYRGWRHYKGLPVRGQRTWSNAWSSYKSNNLLRNFKLNLAKKFYGNIPVKEATVAYTAEHVNRLWHAQWQYEWLAAHKNILKFKGHPKTMKIDLYSMANYQIMHPLKLKNLSKKQKQSFKKNYFSLGFEPGFTKSLLQEMFNINAENDNLSNFSGSSLVLRDERLNKKKVNKKKVDSNIKKTNIIEKRKKKSVWDF